MSFPDYVVYRLNKVSLEFRNGAVMTKKSISALAGLGGVSENDSELA